MIMTAMTSAPAPEGALRLADWGLIRARGDDAATFLHGQLTSDVTHLDDTAARLAGYCSPKGRLLASFIAWQPAPGDVHLACSADLLPAALKRLSMFVLRARCKLEDASAERLLWGLVGAAAAAALGEAVPDGPWQRRPWHGGDLVRLPDALVGGARVPRFLLAGAEPPALTALAPDEWLGLEAASGVARVVGATAEQFVPQMVNLELVGGVDFRKGCYPGQEVVARSQYRGTLKRRAGLFGCAALPRPGEEVFHDADPGQPAGMVALAGRLAGRPVALVEVKLAALGTGVLHLGRPDGAVLQPLPLPYEIPAEAP